MSERQKIIDHIIFLDSTIDSLKSGISTEDFISGLEKTRDDLNKELKEIEEFTYEGSEIYKQFRSLLGE